MAACRESSGASSGSTIDMTACCMASSAMTASGLGTGGSTRDADKMVSCGMGTSVATSFGTGVGSGDPVKMAAFDVGKGDPVKMAAFDVGNRDPVKMAAFDVGNGDLVKMAACGVGSGDPVKMAVCSVGSSEVLELVVDALITCKVCLGEFSRTELHQMEECNCLFCVECLGRYLTVMITEGTVRVVSCPDAQCHHQGKIQPQEIEKLIDNSLYETYVRLKTEQEVDLDPERTWCPEVGCETICQVADANQDSQIQPIPVLCPTCNYTFCSACKAAWHEDQTCDEYVVSRHSDDVGIPFGNEEDAQFKRCPFCQVPLERDKGCAQVMCKRCSHVFCWHCRSSLDHDYLLQHYERGPCQGKLGHPRASIMWYRALVVTIGVLMSPCLLVAVPFMLLIAPCLLCHHYTVCKCCQDL